MTAASVKPSDDSSVFYVCLCDVRPPDDDLKNTETCRSICDCDFDTSACVGIIH